MTFWKELDPRHRKFIDNLIRANFNQKAAYMETYPESNEISAESSASRLMAQPGMREALAERQDQISKESNIRKVVTVERILTRLDREAEEADRAADRIRANELIGKHLRMFGDEGVNVQNNLISADALKEIRQKTGQKKAVDESPTVYEGQDVPAQPEPSNKQTEPSKQTLNEPKTEDVKDTDNLT